MEKAVVHRWNDKANSRTETGSERVLKASQSVDPRVPKKTYPSHSLTLLFFLFAKANKGWLSIITENTKTKTSTMNMAEIEATSELMSHPSCYLPLALLFSKKNNQQLVKS